MFLIHLLLFVVSPLIRYIVLEEKCIYQGKDYVEPILEFLIKIYIDKDIINKWNNEQEEEEEEKRRK